MAKNKLPRFVICGPHGGVRIFDRELQKEVSLLKFRTEAEAKDTVDHLNFVYGNS